MCVCVCVCVSRTTRASQYQKSKTSSDLNEARDNGVGLQWHQLDHMQTICTSLLVDNLASTHRSIFTGRMLFLVPNPNSVKALKAKKTTNTKVKQNYYYRNYHQHLFMPHLSTTPALVSDWAAHNGFSSLVSVPSSASVVSPLLDLEHGKRCPSPSTTSPMLHILIGHCKLIILMQRLHPRNMWQINTHTQHTRLTILCPGLPR